MEFHCHRTKDGQGLGLGVGEQEVIEDYAVDVAVRLLHDST